jgi:hypothetical protein
MVKTKVINQNAFAKLVKELDALGELVKVRQKEKQSVLDSYDAEKKRFSMRKISEKSLESSIKKTNAELMRLDKNIRLTIQKVIKLTAVVNKFLRSQTPKVFRAHKTGLAMTSGKKKKASKKRKAPKKKAPKKKAPKRKAPKRKAPKRKAPKRKAAPKKVAVKPKITGKQVKAELKREKKFIRKQKKALKKK